MFSIAAPAEIRAQEVVGAVTAANASLTGKAPGRASRSLKIGADIFFKDHIATKRGGAAQLTFLDRSTLSVSENSDLVIDEFVYNPGARGTMSATLSKGVLRFVGGDISHVGGTTVKTPTVTIGIRGGIGTIAVVKDAAGVASIPGVPPDFHGGTIVVNGYGTLSVSNGATSVEISRPGFAVFVGAGAQTIAAPSRFDMAAARALTKTLSSQGRQRGGASPHGGGVLAKSDTTRLLSIVPPAATPSTPTIDALGFTSIFSAGNALARNQAQTHQARQLQQQLAVIPVRAPAAQLTTTSTPPSGTTGTPPGTTTITPPGGTTTTPPGGTTTTPSGGTTTTPSGGTTNPPPGGTTTTPPGGTTSPPPGGPIVTPPGGPVGTPPGGPIGTPPRGPIGSSPGGPIGTPPGGPIGNPPGGPIGTPPGGPIGTPPGGPIGMLPGGPIGMPPGRPIGSPPGGPIGMLPGGPIGMPGHDNGQGNNNQNNGQGNQQNNGHGPGH
ncbi:exported protein of unknown function [Beijerinckiaceae bacterium RH AL1]|nr:exported protein of unknown function [Beijerinckiaceae bacterium RH CH11]VVB48264.1 exported protein of unknown function [Beijerinckiaceae bacterium RH AL8]VVC56265.1 exported protein of unknown function [Beijerinckiaceae bacterium RH AL1]